MAVGRTWGPFFYETKEEAYDFINSLPPKAVYYDGEVTIYHWNGDKWEQYDSFGGFEDYR